MKTQPLTLPVPPAPDASTIEEERVYTVAPHWIDTAGRTRTWLLSDPDGQPVAEITTKRDAIKLADFLNELARQNPDRTPIGSAAPAPRATATPPQRPRACQFGAFV